MRMCALVIHIWSVKTKKLLSQTESAFDLNLLTVLKHAN